MDYLILSLTFITTVCSALTLTFEALDYRGRVLSSPFRAMVMAEQALKEAEENARRINKLYSKSISDERDGRAKS